MLCYYFDLNKPVDLFYMFQELDLEDKWFYIMYTLLGLFLVLGLQHIGTCHSNSCPLGTRLLAAQLRT